MSQQFVTRILV